MKICPSEKTVIQKCSVSVFLDILPSKTTPPENYPHLKTSDNTLGLLAFRHYLDSVGIGYANWLCSILDDDFLG